MRGRTIILALVAVLLGLVAGGCRMGIAPGVAGLSLSLPSARSAGIPIANWNVVLQSADGSVREETIPADGRALVVDGLPVGTCAVALSGLDDRDFVLYYAEGSVDITLGQNTIDLSLMSVAWAIELDRTAIGLRVGDTRGLSVTYTPADVEDRTLEWTSSNPDVATVDANGLVSALAAGTTVVTATHPVSGAANSCVVTVGTFSLVSKWKGTTTGQVPEETRVTFMGNLFQFSWTMGTGSPSYPQCSAFVDPVAPVGIIKTTAGQDWFAYEFSDPSHLTLTCLYTEAPGVAGQVTTLNNITYNFSYDTNGGTANLGVPTATFPGDVIGLLGTTVDHAYLMHYGWNTRADLTGVHYAGSTSFVMPAATTVLYAELGFPWVSCGHSRAIAPDGTRYFVNASGSKKSYLKRDPITKVWSVLPTTGLPAAMTDTSTTINYGLGTAADADGNLYVAHPGTASPYKTNVWKYITSTNSWSQYGTADFLSNSSLNGLANKVAVDAAGKPWFLVNNSNQASIFTWNGSAWVDDSSSVTSGFSFVKADFCIDGNDLFFIGVSSIPETRVYHRDAASGTWAQLGPVLPVNGEFNKVPLIAARDGVVVVAYAEAGTSTMHIFRYDAATTSWIELTGFSPVPLEQNTTGLAGLETLGGDIYLFGKRSLQKYAGGSWSTMSSSFPDVWDFAYQLLYDPANGTLVAIDGAPREYTITMPAKPFMIDFTP